MGFAILKALLFALGGASSVPAGTPRQEADCDLQTSFADVPAGTESQKNNLAWGL
jgi:hypothetical protein